MFKQVLTLVRARAHVADLAFQERHALPILAQQIRDCARSVSLARKALALAMAQDRLEAETIEQLKARAEDLEQRAIAAIALGREDLATDSAEVIAHLETELAQRRHARAEATSALARLRQALRQSESRLASLQRGERLAIARDRMQHLTGTEPAPCAASLEEAEDTLARLASRQRLAVLTTDALKDLDSVGDPETILARLAEAGCGKPLASQRDDVLARLRRKANPDQPK